MKRDVNDPLNLESLKREAPASAETFNVADPLADPLAAPPPVAPPPVAPGGPTQYSPVAPVDAGPEHPEPSAAAWAPSPPPPKTDATTFLVVGVCLVAVLYFWHRHQRTKTAIELVAGVDASPAAVLPAMRKTTLLPKADFATPPPVAAPAPAPVPAPVPAPAPVPEVKKEEPKPQEEPEPVPTWTAEGKVYDMLSLRPAFGAKLRFTAKRERPVEVETNEAGRYRATLPEVEGGYTLAIQLPDIDNARYFDEIDPPYRTLEQAERLQLQQMVPSHKPWNAKGGARLRRDLVVVRAAGARIQETDKEESGAGENP